MSNKSFLTRFLEFGVKPDDGEEVRVHKAILAVSGVAIFITLITVFGPLYILFNEPWAGITYISYGVFALINFILYGLWYKNHKLYVMIIAIPALPSHFLVVIFLGGFLNSQGIILWGLFFPVLGMLIFNGPKHALFWFIAYIVNVLLSIFLDPWFLSTNNLPPLVSQIILSLNIITISTATTITLIYFIQQRDLAFRLLRGEQEKAENLLLNILPKDIAVILKNEQRTIAEHFDGASILFADVVNFTPMSQKMSPNELVELLNEVFSYFDTLVEKYGLEKIKTIGDCYMVAAGVPRPRNDHAQILTRMALEMQEFVKQNEFHGQKLSFRIGINSGPVVAGVIGRKKFIYDLWGDAVNTASRMESHGSAGAIQITRTTYELIKNEFVCEQRGTVNVKGKGEMEVWYVTGVKSKT